ncbi:MAG: DUF3429 domain-containing protein [Rhodothalassiaceae bacterium]
MRTVPAIAVILGAAGTLPLLAGLIATWADLGFYDRYVRGSVMIYGAVILSFIGGTHWGFAARERPGRPGVRLLYARSVLPSLAGWGATTLPSPLDAATLALIFVLVLPIDNYATRTGLAPAWWMRLRLPLSAGMAMMFLGFVLKSYWG